MDDAYDKWFNEERDPKAEWGDVLRSAYDAGLKRGLAADRFDPYEDDYDPKRAELLTLSGQLAVAIAPCNGVTIVKIGEKASDIVGTAKAIIKAVDEVLDAKEPTA